MKWHWVDMRNDPRKAHFDYFRTLQNPMACVTVDVDVTDLAARCKAEGRSFYLAFIRVAAMAANGVPELRRRIRGGGVVEYDHCDTSHIELLPNGSYAYCTLHHGQSWEEYFPYAESQRRRCRECPSIEEDADVEGLYFMSCLLWLHYSQLIQPVAGGDDSNPRITWGKYERDWRGRLMMPVTLLAHHGLVDGVHIARFYENLKEYMEGMNVE